MSGPHGRGLAESPSCPLLGLPDDPLSRFSYPSVGHRCRASDRVSPIDLEHQSTFCLAATFTDCPRYQAATAPGRLSAAKPAAGTIVATADTPAVPAERVTAGAEGSGMFGARDRYGQPDRYGLASAIHAPGESGTKPPGQATRWRRVAAFAVGAAVLAGAAYLGGPVITDWVRQMGAGASPASPAPSTPARTVPTPTPSPSLSPAPSPSAAAMPDATATTTPTRAQAQLVHIVARGETLIGIAAQYGVTVASIKKANGITDAGLIYVDQRLIIPPP
jgi:LysM repeat protein